jgi:hypothetical protein
MSLLAKDNRYRNADVSIAVFDTAALPVGVADGTRGAAFGAAAAGTGGSVKIWQAKLARPIIPLMRLTLASASMIGQSTPDFNPARWRAPSSG